jgi:hypothetical protein
MALKKTLTIGSLFAIFASGGFAGIADAQQSDLNVPTATFDHRAIEAPGETGLLATPGVFNYDAQAFAPFEFTNDKQKEPNTGFFFSADKVLFSLSFGGRDATGLPITDLPDGGATIVDDDGDIVFTTTGPLIAEGDLSNVSPSGNQWSWGERYQFGWMGKDNRGFEASFLDVAGTTRFRNRSADLVLTGVDDSGDGFGADDDDDGDGALSDGIIDDINNFGNDFHQLDTTYRVGELNRVFRQVLRNGDVFEPYLGGRYTQIIDNSQDRFVDDIIPADLNGNNMIEPPAEDPDVESRLNQIVNNSAIGFQIGGRHVRRRGRFTFATDGALAVSHNRQRLNVENFIVADRTAGGIAVGSLRPLVEETDEFFTNDSFVPSIDLEFAISYNVTRDITLRAGSNLNYLWQNVARANITQNEANPNFNGFDVFNEDNIYLILPRAFDLGTVFDTGRQGIFEDSFIAAGFTFGVEWRR